MKSLISLSFAMLLFSMSSCAQQDRSAVEESNVVQKEAIKYEVMKTEAEWRALLSPKSYNVTREDGTERAFSGKYYKNKEAGIYECICCQNPLFSSETKYPSGTGWPSYYQPILEENINYIQDDKYGWDRTEVECTRCGAHLGHVFDDGPKPTGKRYCINSASLNFIPKAEGK